MSNLTSAIQLTRQSTYKLNNGSHIPVIGFGTYLLDASQAADLTYQALKDGYRHIDTALAYHNEKEVSQGIKRFLKDHPEVQRSDIWFTTKIDTQSLGYEETKKAVERIKNDVKDNIEYVDLILIHSPLASKARRLGTYQYLQELVLNPNDAPLIVKSIGVSNYGVDHLEELFNWEGYLIKPVLNQLELHPWLPRLELREYLYKHEILAEAYSPLTQGYKLDDPELLAISKESGLTPAEILLKWSFLQGFIVLVKSDKPTRIQQNLDILPQGKKDDDELQEGVNLGVVSLNPDIIEKLNKPESHVVLTWGGKDPTLFKDA